MAILLAEHIQLSTLGAFRESEIFSARLSEGSKSTGVPSDESPNSQAAATVALDFEVLLWPNVLQIRPQICTLQNEADLNNSDFADNFQNLGDCFWSPVSLNVDSSFPNDRALQLSLW